MTLVKNTTNKELTKIVDGKTYIVGARQTVETTRSQAKALCIDTDIVELKGGEKIIYPIVKLSNLEKKE